MNNPLPFDTLHAKINQAISQFQIDSAVDSLYQPIYYALSLGGKRVRPILTLMGANLFVDSVDPALPSAVGIEIFHNFTLLHDDVMDKAELRRGEPTVHQLWGENGAILSGDAMLIVAYEWICKSSPEKLPDLLTLFSRTAREVCEGQQLDMAFEERNDVTTEEYLEMIRLKTAVLLGCSLQMGAIVAGASQQEQEALYGFGVHIGLAFQLQDDLLDVYGDPIKFGKEVGGDIVNNKKTYLLLEALKRATPEQHRTLSSLIEGVSLNRAQKVVEVTELYNQIGVKTLCEGLMEHYFQAAQSNLANLTVSEERKRELVALSKLLMSRES